MKLFTQWSPAFQVSKTNQTQKLKQRTDNWKNNWTRVLLPVFNSRGSKYNTEAKLRFENTYENTTKNQLYQVKSEKVEISLELEKLGYVSGSNLRHSKFESHALPTQPRMLKISKT